MTDIASLTERELLAATILVLAQRGRRRHNIAAVLGLARRTVSDIASELLPPGALTVQAHRPSQQDEIDGVYKLYREGVEITEIALKSGRPRGTIATWIKLGHDAGLLERRMPR